MSFAGLMAVGGGAAAGAWLRWWFSILLNPLFPTLPLGTLAANLAGGLLMGVAMGIISHFETLPAEAQLLMTTGFLGGLTTFSTFSAETTTLILRQQYGWMTLLIGAHVIGSVIMTLVGLLAIRAILMGLR